MPFSPNWILLMVVGVITGLAIEEHRMRRIEGRKLVRFVCTAILKLIQERGPLTHDELRQAFPELWCDICKKNLEQCLALLDRREMLRVFKNEDADVWPLDLTPQAQKQLTRKEESEDFVPAHAVDTAKIHHGTLHYCVFE
ncbi:MAG: hypothetical protein Q7N87_03525 [Candidatus Uhrbacteria bacterium]|nr:hypothetical protein [Candidatus Uhrbacteria bacterium]